MLRLVREEGASLSDVAAAVESDVALAITVLRISNRTGSRKKGQVGSIPEAVEVLTPDGVETLATGITTGFTGKLAPRTSACTRSGSSWASTTPW